MDDKEELERIKYLAEDLLMYLWGWVSEYDNDSPQWNAYEDLRKAVGGGEGWDGKRRRWGMKL